MDAMDAVEVEVVDDWTKLEKALVAAYENRYGAGCGCCEDPADEDSRVEAIETLNELVPRLMQAHEELLTLMDGTMLLLEQMNKGIGLYGPDGQPL